MRFVPGSGSGAGSGSRMSSSTGTGISSGAAPACTRAAAATSAALSRCHAPPAASSATQADSSACAWRSRLRSSGVALRASASHRFMTRSTAAAPSAKLSRLTMRLLPLSVWKPRRSKVNVSWLAGLLSAWGSASSTKLSTSWASRMKISSSSDSMLVSCCCGACVPGAGAVSTNSKGSSRNRRFSGSKLKRPLAASLSCASRSVKKPSAPMFWAMLCSTADFVLSSPSLPSSSRTWPATWRTASTACSWSRMDRAPCKPCSTGSAWASVSRLAGLS